MIKIDCELTIKQLSQFQNGILHENRFRACNRKVLVPDVASTQTLLKESLGFTVALYHTSSLSGSTTLRGIENFVNETISAFHRYIRK